MIIRSLLACSLAATISVSGSEWIENFDNIADNATLRRLYPSGFLSRVVPKDGTIVMNWNGQSFIHRFTSFPLERELVLTARIKVNAKQSFCRISFGGKNISWNHFQGAFDLHSDPEKWHEVRLIIRPNPVRGGNYNVQLDGKTIITGKAMQNDRFELPSSLRIGYLNSKNSGDGAVAVDSVALSQGAALRLAPEEQVNIQLPREAQARTFRNAEINLPFTFSGNRNALQNYRARLHLNPRNQHKEKLPTPTAEAPLVFDEDNQGHISFKQIPFGMYSLQILGTRQDGKDVVLRQEFISRVHPTPRPPKPGVIRWGIDTHGDTFSRQIDLEIPPLVEAGANWTRLEFKLANITDHTGKIHFKLHDKLVAEGQKRGINFFALLNTKPRWSKITPYSKNKSQPDEASWEKVCREIMLHYKGKIRYYEIWNEPLHYDWNGFEPGIERPNQYTKLFLAARRAADSVDPEIKLMGPCMTANMHSWLRSFVQTGAAKKADFLSIHGRPFPDYYSDFYQYILRESGCELPVFVTEGANDPRALVASFADETPSAGFAYTMRDKGTNPKNYEHNNGMLKYDGLPKTRFIQYQFLATMLNNADYVGRIFSAEKLNGYLFREGNTFSAVVWAGESDQLPDAAFAPGVERFDTLGNPFAGRKLESWVRSYAFVPIRSMVFLRNLAPDSDAVLTASVNCSADYRRFQTDNVAKMEFKFSNWGRLSRNFQLTLADKDGIHFESPESITVPPGESRKIKVKITASPNVPAGEIMIDGVLNLDGRKLARRFGPFRFFNPARLKETRILRTGDNNCLQLPKKDTDDIHAGLSTGIARDVLNQNKLSEGSASDAVTLPDIDHPLSRLRYRFTRPAKGWAWLARRYTLKTPVLLPGIPVRLKTRIFMENNIKNYPVVLIFTFRDPTGKEIRIEAGEIFWSGWRDYEVWLPSFISHGHIHSVGGGNGRKNIDALPLKFTGVIVNLVPVTSSVFAPKDLKTANGEILLDDIFLDFYQ